VVEAERILDMENILGFFDDPQKGVESRPARTAMPIAGQLKLASDLPEVITGTNPLTAAANSLLNLIPQLRTSLQQPDPGTLHNQLVKQVQLFEQRARQAGIPNETVIGARYCLCTALDEMAGQTPWGGAGIWTKYSLLVVFHKETWGGEKFFQLLAKLAQNPQQHRDLLELMYYCIALGFEGRFHVVENGHSQLETLKQRLVKILRTANGDVEKGLSPHWRGLQGNQEKVWSLLPVWVAAALAGLIALPVYLWFAFDLARLSDDVFASINNIRLPRIMLSQPAAPRLAKFLEPEIREGLVTVHDETDRSVVILRGDGLFDSGSDRIRSRYEHVIARVAAALNEVQGAVLVAGYTDNVPIRTLRYPSNWQLSQARADSVKAMLGKKLTAPNRVRAEGRADADPIAPNDSPVNRALNRRVEIVLLLPPKERDNQLRKQS
jgi:type VI secretion system protein ImpK